MSATEDFEGFVPLVVYFAGYRVEGKAWKFTNHRLLQQIEEDKRQFLPLVEAKLYPVTGESASPLAEFDVLAVNKQGVIAIHPKDTILPRAPK